MCDIFIEHKFCQLSEYVRFLKLAATMLLKQNLVYGNLASYLLASSDKMQL